MQTKLLALCCAVDDGYSHWSFLIDESEDPQSIANRAFEDYARWPDLIWLIGTGTDENPAVVRTLAEGRDFSEGQS